MMTYRIAHTSDTHVCQTARLQDLTDVLDAFLQDCSALDGGVDLIVHAGDFFDRLSTPAERIALASFLIRASEIAPVFGVKGNHDAPGDLAIFNRLETDHKVLIADRPTRPGEGTLWGPFALLALPWFDKAHLVAGLAATVDAETTRLATIAAAEDLMIGLRAEAAQARADGHIPILVSHAMVQGSVVGSGQTIQGITVELSPHAIREIGAEYAALGHVHMRQAWFDGRVAYSGSPIRHNFGEPEEKGWNLVTFSDRGDFVSNEFRPLPARPIMLLEADFRQGAEPIVPAANVAGALVRLRYKARVEDLVRIDEAAIEKFLRDAGAVDVKLEAIVDHQARVRSEDIVAARTVIEKCDAYWKAKGEDIPPEMRERLTAKLDELERAVPRG